MRSNRKVRNLIEEKLGLGAVEEVERWNDQATDSLQDHGVELSADEEAAQAAVLEHLASPPVLQLTEG